MQDADEAVGDLAQGGVVLGAARAQLAGRGVEVGTVKHYTKDGELAEGKGGRWNAFVFFNDLDGNGWILQERPEGE